MEEKYLVWHVQGGLGKNVAATALCKDIKEKYSDRQFILVCSWPEVFLNNPYTDRVYDLNKLSYFYETYIENKDVIIFKHEPYDQTGHITKQKHLIENWCDLLGIKYKDQLPSIKVNYAQKQYVVNWRRSKPILLLQTNGGPIPQELNNLSLPYAWARDIPLELAQEIIKKYSDKYHIIQITRPGGYELENVERIDSYLHNIDLLSLVASSQKRILIDSCLQHMAASLSLISNVIWIATSPVSFGYKMHNNILANVPNKHNQLINSYTFDFNFDQNLPECPYMNVNEMFNIQEVLNKLGN